MPRSPSHRLLASALAVAPLLFASALIADAPANPLADRVKEYRSAAAAHVEASAAMRAANDRVLKAASALADAAEALPAQPPTPVPATPPANPPVAARSSGVNVLDFGVVGDGKTDDGPAIQRVLDANPGRRIDFPCTATTSSGASYYSSVPLVVTSPGQSLVGEGHRTTIQFARGIVGIDIRHTATRAYVQDLVLLGRELFQQNSLAEGVLPSGFTAARTRCDGVTRSGGVCTVGWGSLGDGFTLAPGQTFTIRGAGDPGFNGTFTATSVTATSATYPQAGPDGSAGGAVGIVGWDLADAAAPTSDGVRVGSTLTRLTNVRSQGFGRHGFNLSNQDCDGGAGTSDNCTLTDCYSANNRGYGIYVAGGDSNASVFTNFNASVNGLGGIYDNSFLGNTWIAPKTDENHFDAVGGPGTNPPPTPEAIASIGRSGHIVTLTFAAPFVGADSGGPELVPGHCLKVSVPSDVSFNGNAFCLIGVSGATVTFAQGGPDATPSAAGATAARALLVDAWDQANIPRTGGSYRTAGSPALRSMFINPYNEGGQSPTGDPDVPTCQLGVGCTVMGGINMQPDFRFSQPLYLGLTGQGSQGFTSTRFPSYVASTDGVAASLEMVGRTTNALSRRHRVAWNYAGGGGPTLWVEEEGPDDKVLYNNALTSAPIVTCWRIDHASGRMSWGVPIGLPAFATADRPTTGLVVGSTCFDTTLRMLVTWDGASWRDQAGNVR